MARYSRRARRFRARAEALGPRSRRPLNLGGSIFLLAVIVLLAVLLGEAPALALLGVAALVAASLGLIVRHARLQKAEEEAWRWWKVNDRSERRCRDAFHDLPDDGAEFVDEAHAQSSDLDVFGPGSLFQLINVAHTRHGQRALARFLSDVAPLEDIRARQAAVRCLAPELLLRQRLETLTSREPPTPEPPTPEPPRSLLRLKRATRPSDEEALLEWAEAPPLFLHRTLLVWSARILPVLTLGAFLASQLLSLSSAPWKVSVGLQVLLALHARRDAGTVAGIVARWQGTFQRLALAFRWVEELELDAPLLQRLREGLLSEARRASVELGRLDGILGWLGLRDSEWGHPPINVLLGWDIHCMVALEHWQRASGQRLRGWLEVLGQVEALCSLSGAAHDNPEFTFPELVEGAAQLSATGLGHPLLAPAVRVSNDVCLPAPGHALLITGSNMSGKSTLLRSLGLGCVMALAGGPVCAAHLRLSPLSVHTSLRVADSVSEGVSRFYAELRRLRAMLEASRGAMPVLFLIDEVLSGTNSVERGIGARWLLAELLRAGAIGAVSTHDAALCQLPAALMARVEQGHFRESVDDGALAFDYRLHAGPVRGGNALRLMRSLGLAIPL